MIDYSGDYRFWSNTEAVTVRLRRSAGDVDVPVATALRDAIKSEAPEFRGVHLTGDELLWRIPFALLQGNRIEIGDWITDAAAVAWNVVSVATVSVGNSTTEFQCLCVKQR